MLLNARPIIISATVAILLTAVLSPTSADKPELNNGPAPKASPLPTDPAPSRIQDTIRQALDGKSERGKYGNGLLDDVLDVIKERGSILDGTWLDDRNADADHKPADAGHKAYVAEQLLKTSRLLEALGTPGNDRITLIRQMRGEAVKLLSE
jgi:hypothetical protein